FQTWTDVLMAWLDRRPEDMIVSRAKLGSGLKIMDDPEAMFQEGWLLCDAGEHVRGFACLRRSVTKGYFPADTLATRPAFDALRGDPAFGTLLSDAQAGRERALAMFRDAGGERLLGR